MRILSFDTATRATSVALTDAIGGLELEVRDDPAPGERPGHATQLLPLIAQLLERVGGGWESIDLLAVGTGPGTFTGLRIGVATARALARARELPLVGISTLRSLALNGAGGGPARTVLAVLDARRGEVFAAAWSAGGDGLGEPILAPLALGPDALAQRVPALGSSVLAIGDGAVEFRSVLERSGASVPEDDSLLHTLSALNHCRLAGTAQAVDPGDVVPEYLRVPDAEIARRAKQSQ